MARDDPMTAERLTAYLDRRVLGKPAPSGRPALDPALVETVRRIDALGAEPTPAPAFVARLEETLMRQFAHVAPAAPVPAVPAPAVGLNDRAPASPVSAPLPRRRRPGWGTRPSGRWWSTAELAAVAVLLLALAGGYFGRGRLLPAGTNQPGVAPSASSAELYVSSPDDVAPEQRQLSPLDPTTLADRHDRPAISLADPDAVWTVSGADPTATWAASADGSTLVNIEPGWTDAGGTPSDADTIVVRDPQTADAWTITVRDGRTGAIRRRFPAPWQVSSPRLSRDGTRLVVETGIAWYHVFDMATGRLLVSVPTDIGGWNDGWIDPTARRLYLLETTSQPTNPGPSPQQLVAYDLTTGKVSGRLALPDILGGTWQERTTPGPEPLVHQLQPAGALSPDGRRLAIVHADSEAVTLIDPTRLTVVRTFTPAPATGLGDRLLSLLPLAPQGAAAKEFQGTTRQAVFSPDGKRLYVFGGDYKPDGGFQSAGLRAIDVERGMVVAEGLPGALIDRVLPMPGGRGLYVFGPAEPPGADSQIGLPYLLQRLDATTLSTGASRTFDGNRWILVRPAATP